MKLNQLDHEILNILQNDFPLEEKPYAVIAKRLNISETEVLEKIRLLKEAGIIRRIGGVIDSKKIGFYSTLCACHAEEQEVLQVAEIISEEKGVTHNYIRDNWYNIWFTLTSPSKEAAAEVIKKIEQKTGCNIKSMPAKKVYKIKAVFMAGENDG